MRRGKLLFIGYVFVMLFVSTAIGQPRTIQLDFESEGKSVDAKNVLVIFHSRNGSYVAKTKKNHLVIPTEVLNQDVSDVQIVWNNYSAIFASVEQAFLKNRWTIGVDKGPEVNSSLRSTVNQGKDVLILYYLKLDPDDLVKVITVEVLR